MPSKRRPGEGIFHYVSRRQSEALLEQVTRSLHKSFWAPGDSAAQAPEQNRRPVVEGESVEASPQTRDIRNGLEGAFHGYKGGRRREWTKDPRYQQKMEEEIASRIDEGLSDREIADAVFGDRALYKRVQRFRRSRKPGS
jgi:hypothetical protein